MRCFIPMTSVRYYESNTSINNVSLSKQYLHQWLQERQMNHLWKGVQQQLEEKFPALVENSWTNDLSMSSAIQRCTMFLDVYTWLLASELLDVFDYVKYLILPEEGCALLHQTLTKTLSFFQQYPSKDCEDMNLKENIQELFHRYVIFMQILLKKTESRQLTIDVFACNIVSFPLLDTVTQMTVGFEQEITGGKDNEYQQLFTSVEGLFRLLWRTQTLHRDEITKFLNTKLKCFLSMLFDDEAIHMINIASKFLHLFQVIGTDVFGFELEATSAKQQLPHAILTRALALAVKDNASNNVGIESAVHAKTAARELARVGLEYGTSLDQETGITALDFSSQQSSNSSNAVGKFLNTRIPEYPTNMMTLFLSNKGGLIVSHFSDFILHAFNNPQNGLYLGHAQNRHIFIKHLTNRNILALFDKFLVGLSSSITQELERDRIITLSHSIFDEIDQQNMVLQLPEHTLMLILSLESQCALFQSHHTQFITTLSKACIDTFSNANKVDVSEIQSRLSWLPFLIPGITNTCPRPMRKASLDRKLVTQLCESVEEMTVEKFPLESKQLNPDSDQGREYLAILKSYLQAFEQTGCSHLLTPLLPSFREGKAHRYYDYLKDTLLRTAEDITLPSIESADEICDICNFSLNVVLDSFQDLIVKRVFFQSIFLPTIEKLNTKDFHRIVSSGKQGLVLNMTLINMPQTPNFVKSLMDIITKDINYITAESHEIQTILFLQICSFRMLEFLFDHCALKDIKTSFTQLYVGEGVTCTGKELTQALCKVAFKVGKAPVANFTYEDLLLELRAAAYRCLAVTVAKTQTEEQFFDTFLFKTKPGEDLWNKITLAGLTSPHELQEIVLKTDYESFETLRFGSGEESQLRPNDMTRLRRLAIHARVGAGKGGALTQYVDASMLVSSNINMGSMATQSALDTSTSASDERVTSEYSPSQYQLLVDTASKSSSTKSYEVDNEEDVVAGWDDHVIYLEMNHFNQASIMPVLVRVVQRMFVVFKDKWEKNLAVLPNWLNEVKTKLSDFTSTAATTRLFFLRLILNQPIASLIEPWIQELMPAILECASMDLCPSSHASAKYCYLLRDLVFTLCDTWKRALPNAFSVFSASKILSFLLANVKDDDIDKLKENTLSVCALIKLWIGAQSPGQNEYSLKVDQLVTLLTTEASFTGGAHAKADSKGSINVRLRLAGLELLSTLLSVKYPLLQKHGPESAGASRLIESVLSCLRFPRKEVMEFACKVAGEMLKAFHSSTQQHLLHEDLQSLDNNLRTVIESKNHLKDGPDQMIACIRKVVEQCPSFVSREMIMKIVNSFPKLKFKSKYDYLYVLSNATNEFEDLSFIDLMRPYFKSNFADLSTASFGWGSNALRLPVVQVGTLLYLSKHVHQINADHVSVLLGSSEAEGVRLCTSSKSPLQVRDAAYQFLITLCRTHAEILACITSTEAATVSTSWKKVAKDVLKMLLTGLTDSDDEGMFVDDVTEQFHTFADYENPKFWSKSNQLRMGIRKRIYAFFMKDFGLGANLAERVLVVSSTLFDPTNEDWIKSAGYLLLHGILSDEKANAKNPLFTNNLAPTESYTEYQIPANRLFMATSKSSMTMPMFSLERTTQSINSILQSQQMTQAPLSMSAASIILSQSNITATQGFRRMTPLGGGGRSGVIKGTQQMSWTQTQSEEASSSSVIGTNLSSSKGYSSSSTSASSSTYANNLTQFGSTTTMSQATKYHTPASQGAGGDIDSMLMPPPSALPKYITTQRVPTRFKSKASTGDASDSTASTATRKVNIQQIFASKKLKADEEAKRKQRVSFFRRYRTGDLPDISISLQDAFAPLSLVCLYQPAVSYQIYISITQLQLSNETFLSSFAKQVVSNINSSRGVANDARMISMLVDRLNQCQLKLSQHTNLTPVMIPDRVVTDLCMETGNMFVGLEYLEAKLDRMILHDAQVALPAESQVDEASSSKVSSKRKKSEISQSSRSKSTRGATLESTDSVADALFDNSRNARIAEGSSTAVTTTSDNIAPLTIGEYIPTWSQLIRLYDQLKEHDILMGLALKVTSNSSYSVKTKLALDAELRGDYLEALTLYNEMADESWSNTTNDRKRNREEDEVKQVDTSIVDLWLDRSMNCTQKLGDWNKLHDFMVTKSPLRNIESNVASLKRSSSGDRAPLPGLQAISSNDLQKYVPVYLRTLLHIVGDNPPDQNELIEQGKAKVSSFMDRVFSEHLADKAWLEANSSIELAMANILQQDWTKGKMHSEMAYETFLQKWASLHPSAFQAREMLLLQLQKIVEIRDICASQWHNNTAIRQENYEDDLIYLWNLSDPSINDPLHHWLDISMIRKFGLSKGFGKALATTSSLHVAQFQVKTALAGAHQGVLPVIKSLLEKNNQLRKPIFGSKRVILTMNEVNVVTLYNQKSILRKPLDSPEILDMLQKTEKLLKRKQELLTQCEREHQSNANVEMIKQAIAKERLQVSLLQGDWSMFWHRYESDKSSHATGLLTATNASHHSVQQVLGEKKLASMQSYLQAMQQTTGTDQSWLLEKTLSTMTKFCDQLLDDLEGRLAVGSSAAEEFAEQLMVLIQQHPMVKSLSAVDKKKSTSLQDSILNKFAYFVVVMMVQGLQVGSSYCRDRILRMISIVSKYPTYTKDYFTAQLANIPSWVFLRFANQMMGNLDQVEGPTVLPILTRLCTEYPFAMHYNYRITSENFGKQGQQLSAPLKVQLANKSIDAFVEALNGLTHPELRWTDGLKELDTLLKQYQSLESSSKAKTMLGEDIIAIFQQLKDDCLATSWSHVGNLIGKYNLQFAKYANKEVQSILGNKDVEKALLTTKNTIEKLRAISSNHQQRNTHLTSGKVDLVEFSTWLSDFDDLTTRLEVPGQYSQYTHRKPSPHLHEYISSVDQKLLVMTSIRKPKRVKFYGHLGNESMFLVKGGEDLRNDERIEQLFMLMNQVVQQRMNASASSLMISNVSLEELCGEVETRVNAAAAASNSSTSSPTHHSLLQARTYTVVPMSSKVGILEWVKNTIPLKSILSQEMAKDAAFLQRNPQAYDAQQKEVDLSKLNAYRMRLDWIRSHDATDYHDMFAKAQRHQAEKIYHTITSDIPKHFVKKYFQQLTTTPEAYFTFRSEFARSLAVSSVYGYILGIGDRHLENLLIDTRRGSVVQIDFGICFGIGSSMLPVPELIPFRLTPQLRHVLQPLDGTALLRQYMIKVFQILREDSATASNHPEDSNTAYSGVIANALEIYINDPVVDWLKGLSSKNKDEIAVQREMIESSTKKDGKRLWEPVRRIQIAIRKLRGEDPIQLMLEDLRQNNAVIKCKTLNALTNILESTRTYNGIEASGASGTISSMESQGWSQVMASAPPSTMAWEDSMAGGSISSSIGSSSSSAGKALQSTRKFVGVGEQVDLLINMATDPNVLARQWGGLQTWL